MIHKTTIGSMAVVGLVLAIVPNPDAISGFFSRKKGASAASNRAKEVKELEEQMKVLEDYLKDLKSHTGQDTKGDDPALDIERLDKVMKILGDKFSMPEEKKAFENLQKINKLMTKEMERDMEMKMKMADLAKKKKKKKEQIIVDSTGWDKDIKHPIKPNPQPGAGDTAQPIKPNPQPGADDTAQPIKPNPQPGDTAQWDRLMKQIDRELAKNEDAANRAATADAEDAANKAATADPDAADNGAAKKEEAANGAGTAREGAEKKANSKEAEKDEGKVELADDEEVELIDDDEETVKELKDEDIVQNQKKNS